MRAAVYYAPDPADPLWSAGASWLGRDAETAARVPGPAVPGLHEMTADPRRYGFHATLKPPMRLRTAYHQLLADAEALAGSVAAFDLPALAVTELGGFLALRDLEPCPALRTLADRCVDELDAHRAPPTEPELARRRARPLSPEQDAMLVRWGYPHVFGTWFFHMTLTQRLTEAERASVRPAAEEHFRAALAVPRRVAALCIFTQASPDAPFLVAERLPLRGG